MPEDPQLTDTEVGKTVVTPDGDEIGQITDVHNNVATVEPDPGLADRFRAVLDWEGSDSDSETYRLQAGDVSNVTADTVVVHGSFEE